MKHFPRWTHLTPSPAVPGLNGVCGLSFPGAGIAFAGGPAAARWRSRCGGRGLRRAGRVAACPAAGCLRLSSLICCAPIIPQVRPGMSSAGRSRRRRTRRNPFHGRGGRPKADHVGFFAALLNALKRPVCAEGISRNRASWIPEMRRAANPRLLLPRAPLSFRRPHPKCCTALLTAWPQHHPNSSGSGSGSGSSISVSAASSIASWKASLNSDELRSSGPSSFIRSPASRMMSESVSSGAKG